MAIEKIKGSTFSDERGSLKFFNSFNMEQVKRFYEIKPSNIEIIRAWQGHVKEKKWFYCNAGEFRVNLAPLDSTGKPMADKKPESYILKDQEPIILSVPNGYASGFKATKEDSSLMVFSDSSLEDSTNDDFRFPLDQWEAEW